MKISGRTRLVPIVGHPVGQVVTPPIVNEWLAGRGIDVAMIPMDVWPRTIGRFFDLLRGWPNAVGCSVTLPYKQAAFEACDRHSERARRVGAVNTIRRDASGLLHGDMTDGLAMVQTISGAGQRIAGARVLLAGAGGGAGMAIADALCTAGAAAVAPLEPHPDRLARLKAMVASCAPEVDLVAPDSGAAFDMAINASPLGMSDTDPLPFDPSWVAPGGIVADAVTREKPTPLLRAAARAGLSVRDGAAMGHAQIEAQMSWWALADPDCRQSSDSTSREFRSE